MELQAKYLVSVTKQRR